MLRYHYMRNIPLLHVLNHLHSHIHIPKRRPQIPQLIVQKRPVHIHLIERPSVTGFHRVLKGYQCLLPLAVLLVHHPNIQVSFLEGFVDLDSLQMSCNRLLNISQQALAHSHIIEQRGGRHPFFQCSPEVHNSGFVIPYLVINEPALVINIWIRLGKFQCLG